MLLLSSCRLNHPTESNHHSPCDFLSDNTEITTVEGYTNQNQLSPTILDGNVHNFYQENGNVHNF